MIGVATTIVILCLAFFFAMLVGVVAYGFTLAPIIIDAVLTYLAIKWLLRMLRNTR